MKQNDLFIMPEQSPRYSNKNPMVRIHDFGPEGKKCKHCDHCYYRQFSKRYYKCEYRGDTRGEATDHRCNWDACSKFKEKQDD